MKLSCGILLKSNGLYLIAHSTKHDQAPDINDRCWSVPKGVIDLGETELTCAIREFFEETGLDLDKYFSREQFELVHEYRITKKVVKIFFVEDKTGTLISENLECKSLVMNCPNHKMNGLPELDRFEWVSKSDAKDIVTKSQKSLFEIESI